MVCTHKAENKSSVRYEVIAGIISIINQRFSRGAGGEVGRRKVEGGGRADEEDKGGGVVSGLFVA